MLINRGNRGEVHIVDGELLVAVYKINATRPNAVNGWNIQLHDFDLRRHSPSPQVKGALVSG
jgi:hypothetical protein